MRDKEHRNIYYDKTNKTYRVQFGIGGRNVFVGVFPTFEDAKLGRDRYIEANGWRPLGRGDAKRLRK